jgi:eukaryotic-like serine/threonine-protein kinase
LTNTGTFLGTPSYASLEQLLDSKRVKEPTDVFALGVILFHLLTGQYPFPVIQGYPTDRYVEQRSTATPKSLTETTRQLGLSACPQDLANICRRCLIRIDQGRIATAASLAYELEDFLHI